MATTFGARPEDTVADSRGNVLSGVVLSLYPTQADATNQTSLIATVSTNSKGLWPYSDTASRSLLWVRDPNGAVWPTGSQEALGSVGGKADQTYVDAGLDARPTKTFLGFRFPAIAGDFASLQDAAIIAQSEGTRLHAAGIINTNQTLQIECDADISGIDWQYTGTSGTAIVVGNSSSLMMRKDIRLPRSITAQAKTTTGWGQVAGTVGVKITNAYSCFIRVPKVTAFETGVLGHGQSPNGSSYNEIELGHIDNCKIDFKIAPQSTGTTPADKATSGWFNQNTIIGGRLSHNSNEGVQVAGTANIYIDKCGNSVNNNVFLGTSIESPNVVEYHIVCYGQYNYFDRCRFENTGGDANRRVWWRSDGSAAGTAKGNVINGGFNAGNITEVLDAGVGANDIRSDVFNRFTGGTGTQSTIVVENSNSSTAPAITIVPAGATGAGTAPSTGYAAALTANKWQGKRSADSFNRVEIDVQNAQVKLGDGTAAPTGYIGGSASALFVGGAVPFIPLANGSQDLGGTSSRWRKVYANNLVRPFSTKTANYTLINDVDTTVAFNGTSLTATLPDPTTATVGSYFTIKNVNASALTVNSAGTSKTLDGAASQSLAQWAKATYVSDGTQWLTVA